MCAHPYLCVCVCVRPCLSTSEETNNNGMAHWVRPHYSRIQNQRRWVANWRGHGGWAEQFFYCLCAKWRLENGWEACVGRVQRLAAFSGRRWAGKQVAFNFQGASSLSERKEQRQRLNNIVWVLFAWVCLHMMEEEQFLKSNCAAGRHSRWKYQLYIEAYMQVYLFLEYEIVVFLSFSVSQCEN